MSKKKRQKKVKKYEEIEIDFLEQILGEEWLDQFNHGWGNKKDFLVDYNFEYREYKGKYINN